ncbi:hypothetical protein GCM10027296_21160 [Chitinimonas naiadis]
MCDVGRELFQATKAGTQACKHLIQAFDDAPYLTRGMLNIERCTQMVGCKAFRLLPKLS